MKEPQTIIGHVAQIELLDFDSQKVIAKVNTGADISSIWASEVVEKDKTLTFVLFGPKSPHYTGQVVRLHYPNYRLTRIANSFGAKEMRYVVQLRVKINDRIIKSIFSLADRSEKTYPILLGRRVLNKKFLVDVSLGEPLIKQEKAKRRKMHIELGQEEG